MNLKSESSLLVTPIGFMRDSSEFKYQNSPQPEISNRVEGVIELLSGQNFEPALRDLEGFDRIWVIWWFHKNKNWRPTTLPPRGRTGRKGMFSSRSPYRPNPIAMSCLPLLGIEGLRVLVGSHDLLGGTPVLDIKPYIPKFDAFPDERAGWFDELEESLEDRSYRIEFRENAVRELIELPDLRAGIEDILCRDPFPHRTRRIVTYEQGYRLSCGDWRVYYQIEGKRVVIERVEHRNAI